MLKNRKNAKLMFWTVEVVLVATLIFISTKIQFIFLPIGAFFSTLFTPILVAGFLYYILNPVVELLEKRLKIKRIYGILMVFVVLVAIITLSLVNLIPSLIYQISDLAGSVPSVIDHLKNWAVDLEKHRLFQNLNIQGYLDKVDFQWADILKKTLNSLANSLGSIFSVVTQTIVLVCTVPFILFYMLKDGQKITSIIVRFFKPERQEKVGNLLAEMNKTIATYISGQAIECLFVFVMMLLGYFALGLKQYAFLFALIAGLCNLIPYVGPYLGLAPSFLFTVFTHPVKALIIVLLVLVVQQIDGNLIYPNVIGKTLKIHPLTIIFVLMIAGNLAGLIGIFIAIPFYAICKTVLRFIVPILREKKKKGSTSTPSFFDEEQKDT